MVRTDWDWLRLIGMGGVLLVHAAEPFNPWDAWHIVDPGRSPVLGEVVLFFGPWVMPLFLYLAGAAAWRSRFVRSRGQYVRRRLLRIGLPLAIGTLVLVPPQVYLQRRFEGTFDGGFAEFYPHFFDGFYPRGNFALFHLWFVAFLLVTTLVLLPAIEWLGSARGRAFVGWSARAIAGPAGFLRLMLAVLALRLATWLLFPNSRFVMEDWSGRVLLPVAFLLGAAAASDAGFERVLRSHRTRAIAGALAASAVLALVAWFGDLRGDLSAPGRLRSAALWAVFTSASWCWLVGLVAVANHHLRDGSVRVHRWSAGVYPFYLVHQPAVVALAYVAVAWSAPVAARFAFVLAGSFVASFVLAASWVVFSERPGAPPVPRPLPLRSPEPG